VFAENASYFNKRAEFYAMASSHPGKELNEILITTSEPRTQQVHHPSKSFLKSNRTSPYLNVDNQHLLCYYPLQDDDNPNPLLPEGIDPFLCTHLIIAFATVENCTLQPLRPEDLQVWFVGYKAEQISFVFYLKVYSKVVALKEKNPALKVMLSVGQMTQGGGFYDLVVSEARRKR